MRVRFISLVLALVLVISAIPAVFAYDHGMTDISGHWAEADIAWVLDMGLFNGTGADTFSPNGEMTRGMFVTVLGRYAGIDPDDYEDWYLPQLYTDVNDSYYYAPYINWATRHGIASGTGNRTFSPDAPITREQMAVFLVRFANAYGYLFGGESAGAPASFDDEAKISGYAKEAVEIMRISGLLTGRANAQGGYQFDPQSKAVRSECAAVFHRLFNTLTVDEDAWFVEPEGIELADLVLNLTAGDTYQMEYEIDPYDVGNDTVTWISSDPSVASVDSSGLVTCIGTGTAEIWAYTCNGYYAYCTVSCNDYIGYAGESYESKCMHIFGEVVDDPRHPYEDNTKADEFVANLVTISVKVWDFKSGVGSEKVTKTMHLQVHKNLAATVKAVFAEIYACEEKYPINSLGGYRWSSKSEHTPGLAIDVNYEANPYVDPNGKVLVGIEFDPENNPYSIPIDGEVQQIFEKYGFTRGIYWRSGYKDYMHFSFFGT